MAQTYEESIAIELKVITNESKKALEEYTKAFDRDFKRLENINKRANKKIWQSSKDYYRLKSAATRAEMSATAKISRANDSLSELQKELNETVLKHTAAVSAGNADAIRAMKQRMGAVQGLIEEYTQLRETAEDEIDSIQRKLKEDMSADIKLNFDADTIEIGEGISEAFTGLASRDALAVGSSIAKSFTKLSLKGLKAFGGKMADQGAKMEGGGALAKVFGGMLRTLGPALSALGKIGPILGMVGSGLMAIVKLFIDAEAGAKEFQKGILSTTSTLHFLPRNLNDSSAAVSELTTTLKGMRQAAFSLSNISWGLNKDDYQTTMTELTSAGMKLDKFKDDAVEAFAKSRNLKFDDVAKDTDLATEAVAEFTTETVHMAAAYSRAMGVSLQEVSSLMGEMKGQLGMPLEAIEMSFGKIAADAQESGIEANQFFNIIRGMSADMSLFNNRMDMAGKILAKLTKVMDPRKAGQFLQSLSQFFKGQSLGDRLKTVLMATEGATKVNLQHDIDVKMKGLAADLEAGGIDPEEFQKAFRGGMKSLPEWFAKMGDKLSGGQREAILDAARMQEKVSRGGAINLASALKDASPVAAYKELQLASQRMFHTDLEHLSGTQLLAAEKALNLNDDQLDQFVKFRVSLDMTRAEIAQRIESGKKATDEDRALLKRMNITGTDAEKAAKIRHQNSVKIFENMGYDAQQALTKSADIKSLAEKQAELTMSIMEKLGVFIDWFMNQFYDAIMSIWRLLADSFGSSAERERQSLAEMAARSGSESVKQAVLGAKGDKYQAAHGIMEGKGSFGEKLFKQMLERDKKLETLEKAKAGTKDKTEQEKIQSMIDKMKESYKAQDEIIAKAAKTYMPDAYGGTDKALGPEGLQKMGGPVAEMAKKMLSLREGGMSTEQALAETKTGRSASEQSQFEAAFANARLWSLDPKVLMGIVPALEANMAPDKQAEALMRAQESVDQSGTNQSLKDHVAQGAQQGSIYVHDVHTESILKDLAAAMGATGDATKTPELSAAEEANSIGEAQASEQEATTATLADIYNVLKIKGIRINQSFLENDFKKVLTEGTREAMEEALFEFALLTDADLAQEGLASAMRGGGGNVTGSGVLRGLFDQTKSFISSGDYADKKAEEAKAKKDAEEAGGDPAAAAMDGGAAGPGTTVPSTPGAPAAASGGYMGKVLVEVYLKSDKLGAVIRKESGAVVGRVLDGMPA